MHLDQEQIERLVHGEAGSAARDHASLCEECRMRVADARNMESEVLDLLGHLDAHAARPTAASIMYGARRSARNSYRWAAGIVLAFGLAGAALALPGSPLRDWLRANKESQSATAGRADRTTTDRATGVAVAPGNDLTIQFQNFQEQGVVTVRIVAAGDVVVRSLAGTATFTSATARLLISNSGSGDFEIEMPRSARRVVILAGDRRLLLKQGSTVTGAGATAAGNEYVLNLRPPR